MIELVLKRAGEQRRALYAYFGAAPIEPFDDQAGWPNDGRVEAGDAEAAFIFELHTLELYDLRVDDRDQRSRIASHRHVHHKQPQRHADLRGGQANAGRRVHRLDHVIDQEIDVRCDCLDVPRTLVERAFAIFQDWTNHSFKRQNAEIAEETLIGKAIHDTLDPGSQQRDIKVDEKADLQAHEAEIGQQLGCMYSFETCDGFDFDDHDPLYEYIEPIATIELHSAEFQGHCDFALNRQSSVRGLEREAGFVRGFQHSWTKRSMHMYRRGDDCVCQRIEI